MTTPRVRHPVVTVLVRGLPHPGLQGVVGDYADFEQRSDGPAESGEAATAAIVLIVDLDQGWSVEGDGFGSFVGGIYMRPVRVRHEGSARGTQVNIEAPALQRLTGVAAGELRDRTVRLEDLFGREAELLAERLYELPDSRARFDALDAALLRRLEDAPPHPRPDVERAWALLRASGGRLPIEELARQLGCSRRHLARRFADDVGASPKQAARLMRFEQARRRLRRGGTLASIAAHCGFADQSHMTREFVELAGAPPSSVPIVQDEVPAPA